MLFKLKDFQTTAVKTLLENIEAAIDLYHLRKRPVTTSLTATTGAGKTVMSAAVIESLFFGSEALNTQPHESVSVLWVTDSPDLNAQTEYRFSEASDYLLPCMVTIDDSFDQSEFERGRIYFINRQKLSKSSNLVKPHNGRDWTIWQTISNTIENGNTDLIMFLDEAHRGMGGTSGDDNSRQTLYAQLIDGHDGNKPMPIVVGISATIERFEKAMSARTNRTNIGSATVSPADVQESGLLKDTISLLSPGESGNYDYVLLKKACEALVESSQSWRGYCQSQNLGANKIVPLMVIQLPNNADDNLLLDYCDQIKEHIPGLDPQRAFANVLGEHQNIVLANGKYNVKYVAPESVEENHAIRILFAKEAISTGWDCPRAEVLFSLRPGKDRTYIMQLIGRMVRTPLAQRVEGNELLNSVTCFLPRFAADTVREVAEYLTGDLTDDTISQYSTRKVIIDRVELEWNNTLPEEVKAAFAQLPTYIKPRPAANAIDRLLNLAGKMVLYGIDEQADSSSKEFIFNLLDSLPILHKQDYETTLNDVFKAQANMSVASRTEQKVSTDTISIDADRTIIEQEFRKAQLTLTKEAVNPYLSHRLAGNTDLDVLDEQARIAAIAGTQSIVEEISSRCTDKADELFSQYRDKIYGLSDFERGEIEEVIAASKDPKLGEIITPVNGLADSTTVDKSGNVTALPVREKHILAKSDDHMYPVKLRPLEITVLDKELGREGTVAWYRNPSGAAKDALQIPYMQEGSWHSMQPDFVFFSKLDNGTIKPFIVDPHGDWLPDALTKLKGLAAYAQKHVAEFKRIEAVSTIDGTNKYIDLLNSGNTDRILSDEFDDAKDIYRELGKNYI